MKVIPFFIIFVKTIRDMKKIHILPTDQPSRFSLHTTGLYNLACELHENSPNFSNHHMYITSDEEIKKSDWCLDIKRNIIFQSKRKEIGTSKKIPIIICEYEGCYIEEDCKKIILTTDPTLITDGVQAIDDEFLEWFVKNPTCEYVHSYNDRVVGYEYDHYTIIIPQEGIDEELLPEFNLSKGVFDKLSNISSKEMPQEFSKLVNENFDELISNESKQGTHYHFIIQNDKYKMLLAMQTYPETKYYFKDDEISVEELILKLDNEQSSEIKYSEDEVRELLIKGLTHNDDKLCGSLVTVQKEIRTANFNVWFEENKKK